MLGLRYLCSAEEMLLSITVMSWRELLLRKETNSHKITQNANRSRGSWHDPKSRQTLWSLGTFIINLLQGEPSRAWQCWDVKGRPVYTTGKYIKIYISQRKQEETLSDDFTSIEVCKRRGDKTLHTLLCLINGLLILTALFPECECVTRGKRKKTCVWVSTLRSLRSYHFRTSEWSL